MTVIDLEVLKQLEIMLGEDSPDFFQELIADFLSDADELMSQMQESVLQSSATGLRNAAHTLKSNSAMFGATHFADLCKDLEYLGAAGSMEGASSMFSHLQEQFSLVRQELEMAQV